MLASYEDLKVGDIFSHLSRSKHPEHIWIITSINSRGQKYALHFNLGDFGESMVSKVSNTYIYSLKETMTMLGLTEVPERWNEHNTYKIEWEDVV